MRATDKQLDAMDRMHIEYPRNVSKEEAQELIGAAIDKINASKPESYDKAPQNAPRSEFKATTMYVSYAKDIFIAVFDKDKNWADQMQDAITLGNQAREAFE